MVEGDRLLIRRGQITNVKISIVADKLIGFYRYTFYHILNVTLYDK